MGQKRILQQVTDFTGEHRRDLDARRRILAATLRLLAQHGYTKLTIGGVATEASVGKATIYRSWPNKAALVLDAVRDQLPAVPSAATDDSRAELLAVAGTLAELFGSSKLRAVLLALVADSADNSELGRHLKEDLIEGRKAASREVVVRAVERGLLPPDTDVSLVLDSWAGTMLFRSLFSEKSLDEETVRRVVDATLASPPRLPGT
ncbi:TetR/AcrR family transcriptional regulator [Streptomyces sp. NPDC001262]|uniref:TetR/AcrR family transcriptional regulator n=1 Tax=Streptomyces TaxID=1883 RepID=UPI0036947A27